MLSLKREKATTHNKQSNWEVCLIAGRQICQDLLGYPRVCALLASSVYKKMADKASDQSIMAEMIAQSRIFADRALDLQSRLYDDDAELAMDLVITEQIVWDITISPMQCAYEQDMLDVLAQTCPQRRLNKIWYSGISSSLGGFWKVFFFAALFSCSIFLMQMNVYKDIGSIGVYEIIFYAHLTGDILEEYRNVLKDLFRFIGILFLCMIGAGVLYHANMYPEHDLKMWQIARYQNWRIWNIIYIPYFQIYGETMLDSFNDNITTPCTMDRRVWESNPDIERCNEYDWVLIVIAAIYMLISNLLLVNLLIAMFSYRFERVQEISEKLWRYLRYEVIMDYRTRIPVPLNLVIRPFYIIYWCCKKQSDEKAAIREYDFCITFLLLE
ncbi:unnamed protein product [Mytilus edulis]|uniref:Ion transport domain-containing protein n=1 Tax=Mytilus edulis TaxID=6550 RepID=A0A8S3R2F8_MYTED|nr:unnamed protein product [Mytilus edulis]